MKFLRRAKRFGGKESKKRRRSSSEDGSSSSTTSESDLEEFGEGLFEERKSIEAYTALPRKLGHADDHEHEGVAFDPEWNAVLPRSQSITPDLFAVLLGWAGLVVSRCWTCKYIADLQVNLTYLVEEAHVNLADVAKYNLALVLSYLAMSAKLSMY